MRDVSHQIGLRCFPTMGSWVTNLSPDACRARGTSRSQRRMRSAALHYIPLHYNILYHITAA